VARGDCRPEAGVQAKAKEQRLQEEAATEGRKTKTAEEGLQEKVR